MFQDNVLQLQWKWDSDEKNPVVEMEKWTVPYTRYIGQYEISFDANTKEGNADKKIKEAWGETLPKLLLAFSEEEFDAVLAAYVKKREELGFSLVMEASTRQVNEAKERLGLE